MERRDFFGVIAAPLLRRLTPPVPMADGGKLGIVNPPVLDAMSPHTLQILVGNPLVDGRWHIIKNITDISGPKL